MAPSVRRIAYLALAVCCCALRLPSHTSAIAGTIRHDVDDAQYLALATQPEFDPVGMIPLGSLPVGGTLISSKWVLTAGHVVSGTQTFTVDGQTYNVVQSVINPGYIPIGQTNAPGVDLALMRLEAPVANVAPAVRYAGSDSLTGSVGTVVGYGRTGTGLTGATVLTADRRAGQNVLDVLGGATGVTGISPNYILADFDNPSNPGDSKWGSTAPVPLEYMIAVGDSGSPVFVEVGGIQRVVGVASFIGAFDGFANADYGDFAAFFRVSVANDWIDDTIAAYWTTAASGSAQSAANWQIGSAAGLLPDHTDILAFNHNATYTVDFSGSNSYDKFLVRQGTVTFALGGGTQTAGSLMQNGSVTVGRSSGDNAVLNLSGGTLAATDAFIARSNGSTGSVNLTSPGTSWTLSQSLNIGGGASAAGGTGSLSIGSGAAVQIADTLRLWSATSALNLNGGMATAGRLEFRGGTIAGNNGGSLTLTGLGGSWTSGTIGSGGMLHVATGASLALSGIGAKMISGGSLHNAGQITWAGANLSGGNGAIFNNLATGQFEAQDNASLAYTAVGAVPTFNNAGVFRKSVGAGVSNVHWNFNNSGTVEIATGTLQFNAGYQQSAGRILLSGGTFNASTPVAIAGGSIEGVGSLSTSVTTAGGVSPGDDGVGQLSFNQNLTFLGSSSLSIDLGGFAAGVSYDAISVGGTLQLGGVLQLTMIDGFESLISSIDQFTIAAAATPIVGAFSNVANNGRLLTSDGSGSFRVQYGSASGLGPNQVVLSDFVPYVPGDFNLDGQVDGADFVIWQTNFPNNTGNATLAMGDANGDGRVDGADFVIWQTNFPTFTTSPPVALATVPEPSGWLLAALAGAMMAGLMQRQRA